MITSSQEPARANRATAPTPAHVAFCIRSLGGGGGAERVMLNLARGFADRGHRADLVLSRAEGHFLDEIPPSVHMIDLQARHPWQKIPFLAKYLRTHQPSALISALNYTNITALLARDLAKTGTRAVVTVHNHLSTAVAHSRSPSMKVLPYLLKRLLPRADAIVAVSQGVADDLARTTGLPHDRITTIYNPVVTPEIEIRAKEPVEHPWFAPDAPPVILGIGKLKLQKDFATLIRAFALARKNRRMRLVILGEGPLRGKLTKLARDLDIASEVDFPGFVANPYAYLARTSVFVLSSIHEGFGNVLAEAMACGCPVVSTDCPSGPNEILEAGKYGNLVPVGMPDLMAQAILSTLDAPAPATTLQTRAGLFSLDASVKSYQAALAPPH